MNRSTIKKAVTFFYPFLDEGAYIVFYGGEPLLAFDHIKYTVSLLQGKDMAGGKQLKYSLTTNGSLITDEMLQFFDDHCFDVMLSFDGLAQNSARKSDSMIPTRELIRRIQKKSYPGIEFSTISVFTSKTVNYLSASLQYIIEAGMTDFEFSLDRNTPWDNTTLQTLENELEKTTELLVSYYNQNGVIPISNFRGSESRSKSNAVFACAAGRKRMSITPAEDVWGCSIFHDYLREQTENPDFRTYWFGKLDNFIQNHKSAYPRILLNYAALTQNFFFTENQFCFLCPEVGTCSVCPVSAAYTTSVIGKISPWVCHLKRLQKKAKQKFLREINNTNPKQ